MLSFLSSSGGSARLRAAYIEHIISSVITRRIFKPFLFTLSFRQQSTDQLFQSWSDHMRSKSTRKEALWRQRTLHAAYTVSSAKESINKVAGSIVDEIIDAIKCFAHRARLERVIVAVRRIVKTAAETWRYARLEIPMIRASMSEEERPFFMKSKIDPNPAYANINMPGRARQVLLPLFPIIEREAIHEDIREDSKMNDHGCTYFPGSMLYVDDPEVINSLNATDYPHASMTKHHSTDVELDIEKTISKLNTSDDKSMAQHETSLSPLTCSSIGWQLANLPSASPERKRESSIVDVVDVKPNTNIITQVDYDSRQGASSESRSLTPMLSQSSATSGSSTEKSTSTTRPGDLPDWGSKGVDIFG